MSADALKKYQQEVKPAVDASMDAVCIIDTEGKLVYYNLVMKSFLSLKNRELTKQPSLGDLLKLTAEGSSQLRELFEKGTMVRLDESPASRGKEKVRISFRAVPLYDPAKSLKGAPIGALITLRDTTGEILLQAKYHKLLEMMMEKDSKIADLEDRLKALRSSLRKARVDTIS